ncbi:S26 family signal peptidase, partial [Virgibacillus halodenitrificans]|nr:S26 family signal peptidase [Virgibacillus halodenitrificans]
MKRRVVMKWVNRLVSTILMVLLITVAGIVLSTKLSGGEPQVFGYQLKTVLSGSMEPGIQTGSIIAV